MASLSQSLLTVSTACSYASFPSGASPLSSLPSATAAVLAPPPTLQTLASVADISGVLVTGPPKLQYRTGTVGLLLGQAPVDLLSPPGRDRTDGSTGAGPTNCVARSLASSVRRHREQGRRICHGAMASYLSSMVCAAACERPQSRGLATGAPPSPWESSQSPAPSRGPSRGGTTGSLGLVQRGNTSPVPAESRPSCGSLLSQPRVGMSATPQERTKEPSDFSGTGSAIAVEPYLALLSARRRQQNN